MIKRTAKQFLKEIEKEQNLYKLVNGLFIVKYINKEECIFIGEFEKAGTGFNKGKTNRVFIGKYLYPLYNPKKKIYKISSCSIWKKLNIAFKEKPIKEIKGGL